MLIVLLGTVVITYGITRWWTTRTLIVTHETIVDAVHKEHTVDTSKDTFSLDEVSGEVAMIRERMFNSQGPHQWMKGMIVFLAVGVVTVLSGVYLRCKAEQH
jgi:hypothetical protein